MDARGLHGDPFHVVAYYGTTVLHSLCVGWNNLFSSYVVSIFDSDENQVLVYILMYLEYNTVVVVC